MRIWQHNRGWTMFRFVLILPYSNVSYASFAISEYETKIFQETTHFYLSYNSQASFPTCFLFYYYFFKLYWATKSNLTISGKLKLAMAKQWLYLWLQSGGFFWNLFWFKVSFNEQIKTKLLHRYFTFVENILTVGIFNLLIDSEITSSW